MCFCMCMCIILIIIIDDFCILSIGVAGVALWKANKYVVVCDAFKSGISVNRLYLFDLFGAVLWKFHL